SQRLAMHLLRRAQASKGIFSINDLFKEFVLTEPHALARWDVTLMHYQEASRLYELFELAKTKTEMLKNLPDVAGQYRSASRDAVGMRALARAAGRAARPCCPPDRARGFERVHLLFRDYLRSSADAREAYAAAKHGAATVWHNDRAAYTEAKSDVILGILDRAETWADATGWEISG